MADDPEQPGGPREPDARFTLANERTFLAWVRTALASFKRREFKPGTQSYKLTKDV